MHVYSHTNLSMTVFFLTAQILAAESQGKEHISVLTALLGYIDVLITWLMNANYITAYLMPEMPIAASSEITAVHFYSPASLGEENLFLYFHSSSDSVCGFCCCFSYGGWILPQIAEHYSYFSRVTPFYF